MKRESDFAKSKAKNLLDAHAGFVIEQDAQQHENCAGSALQY